MKYKTTDYSRSYDMQDLGWEKIVLSIELENGDKVEDVLTDAKNKADAWHIKANKDFYDRNPFMPVNNKKESLPVEDKYDKEWEIIKEKLMDIKYMEDALEYINTTTYSMTINAKKIINNKPSKNEKK